MQKSNHICYNTSKYACFKPYNTYTNSMLKYCKKVVKKACNLQININYKKYIGKLIPDVIQFISMYIVRIEKRLHIYI